MIPFLKKKKNMKKTKEKFCDVKCRLKNVAKKTLKMMEIQTKWQ
jgi:hypothetical protein